MIDPTDPSRPDESPSTSRCVVERVAAAEGVDPAELERPLYDAVDGDALDALVRGAPAGTTVEFEFHGYAVTVNGGSPTAVTVDPIE